MKTKNWVIIVLAVLVFSSCQNSSKNQGTTKSGESNISLTGAGATFPMPYYNMVFKQYSEKTGQR
jgi:phosphate transport system substrate-binding protein